MGTKMKRTDLLPSSLTAGLVIRELDDETLIYDTDRNEAHCLNQTAALVWKYCDGKTTAAQAANFLQSSLYVDIDVDLISLAVKQLERFDLVEKTRKSPRVSRRKLILRYAPAALALPAIMSISAPTPAQSASCAQPSGRPFGCPCSNDSECDSFNCNAGTCGPAL
jgi:hypothetical protein